MVVVNDTVNIYDLETASVTGTVTNPKRISSVKFLNVSSPDKYSDFLSEFCTNKR